MSDLISKAEVLSLLESMMETYWDRKQILSVVRSNIEKLPSAEPKWIPTSERLPEKDDIYLVNVKDGWFPKNVLPIDLLRFEGGKWTYFEFETDSFEEFENPVVAWMLLPEPYKGGDAE